MKKYNNNNDCYYNNNVRFITVRLLFVRSSVCTVLFNTFTILLTSTVNILIFD